MRKKMCLMKLKALKIFVLFISVIFFLPTLLHADSFEGKVVGVSDGDMIKVLKGGKQIKVKLSAIDCPEKGQPFGQVAKKFTAKIVDSKIVKVWSTDTDRYGRIVALVFVGKIDLNRELLKAGLTWRKQA